MAGALRLVYSTHKFIEMAESASVLDWKHEVDEEVVYLDGTPRLKLLILTRKGESIANAKNIILWHQGLGEHSGRVKHVGGELLMRSSLLHAFCTADIRGHGGSEGGRGVIDGYKELENDWIERVIPDVIERSADDLRVIIAGHSLGGLIAAGVANRADVVREHGKGQQRISGVFLSAPAITPVVQGVVNRTLAPVVPVIAALPFMRRVTKANDISGRLLTHDEKIIDLYNGGDSELTNQISIGLSSSLLTRGNELVRDIPQKDGSSSVLRSSIPVLIIHGGKDNLTQPEGSRRLAEAISHEVEFVVCPDALHEMYNESKECGRKQFFDNLVEFIGRAFTINE